MKNFDFTPELVPTEPMNHILVGRDTIEVYVNRLGQVAMKQSGKSGEAFICLAPSDVPELIRYLTAVAQEAESSIRPSAAPAVEHSSVRIWDYSQDKLKPFYVARVDGCGAYASPDGGIEVRLDCLPQHLVLPVHCVVVKFHESLFREISSDGLRLLDHKPPTTRN